MKSSEIRDIFLEFFSSRGHHVAPGSSLVPDDPTLLLTNAGMVQFKPYFLGEAPPPYRRATSAQKCVRTTDIESVGITARHNTFFEMLGNFSFGDYYKDEAIPWAWEFLTSVLEIDPGSLWMSVYEEDDEAERVWKSTSGVAPERVIRLGAQDNFWDMGDTGPCGPCSEILYDRGEKFACSHACGPGCDCDRFLELWNLVFMQYDRRPDMSLVELPRKNIDTGMGLERVAAVKQGASTIFEIDIIMPVIEAITGLCGVRLGDSPGADISVKVIADHSRAATFLISDGVMPSNEGRGYILRRLLRRAVRHGRLLGIEGHFIDALAGVVTELLGDVYPGLKERNKLVTGVITSEEESFDQTLDRGVELLSNVIEEHKAEGKDTIGGKTVFYLHDTLGFPLELTREIVSDKGMKIDHEGFGVLMEEQRERARLSRKGEMDEEGAAYSEASNRCGRSRFEGYERNRLETTVTAIIIDENSVESVEGERDIEVVLERTPFYAESGGQVGDSGVIEGLTGAIAVETTFYGAPDLAIHRGRISGALKVGDTVTASVDVERRLAIARNHSATHLVHWALRDVLGAHARQAGSLVAPDRLRFDFTHFDAVSPDEIARIEMLVNERVLDDAPVRVTVMAREAAIAGGAMALFGEKYGEEARVVEIGDFSKELCGGTHVERAGNIGPVRITAESSVGAGLRRIEATSGFETLRHYRFIEGVLRETEDLLKVRSESVPLRVAEMLIRVKDIERVAAKERSKSVDGMAGEITDKAKRITVGGADFLFARVDAVDQSRLRNLADVMIKKEESIGAVALVAVAGEKAQLVVKVAKGMVGRLNARDLADAGGKMLGGGGGGREDMGIAGGPMINGADAALLEIEKAIKEKIEAPL